MATRMGNENGERPPPPPPKKEKNQLKNKISYTADFQKKKKKKSYTRQAKDFIPYGKGHRLKVEASPTSMSNNC